uniref:Uncharacterized protein n=1 Tax=Anopheles dirus TaxID=7168 RepID=A0A182NYX8_9DIPT
MPSFLHSLPLRSSCLFPSSARLMSLRSLISLVLLESLYSTGYPLTPFKNYPTKSRNYAPPSHRRNLCNGTTFSPRVFRLLGGNILSRMPRCLNGLRLASAERILRLYGCGCILEPASTTAAAATAATADPSATLPLHLRIEIACMCVYVCVIVQNRSHTTSAQLVQNDASNTS